MSGVGSNYRFIFVMASPAVPLLILPVDLHDNGGKFSPSRLQANSSNAPEREICCVIEKTPIYHHLPAHHQQQTMGVKRKASAVEEEAPPLPEEPLPLSTN
jgi:hypothetical protein